MNMKMANKIRAILALILIFGLSNCGSDGTSTTIPFNSSALSGFYVVSSTPAHNQFYVSESTNVVTIRMSEVVNGDTATSSNVQVVKKTTGEVLASTVTVTAGSEIITISGLSLALNTDYQVRLYPGLAATSGNTLLQGQSFEYFYVDFSTGSGGTLGNTVAGAPHVNSVVKTTTKPGCAASVLITFNESLAYQPNVSIKYYNPFAQEVYVYAYPALVYDNSVWQVDLCVPDKTPSTNIHVHVNSYTDLEGLSGAFFVETLYYF